MATYLVTGARAPAALDIVRRLGEAGHKVYVTDPWRYPIGSQSKWVSGCLQTAEPATATDAYIQDIIDFVIRNGVAFVLPVCEEVLYLATHKQQLENYCVLLADHIEKLKQFHSKYALLAAAADCGISLPETTVLDTIEDYTGYAELANYVFKPEYSRFGHGVEVNLTASKLQALVASTRGKGLLQLKVRGTEYCSFSIAYQGRLTAHMTYLPKYRLDHSASFYFEPIEHSGIKAFVSNFVRKHQFSGAISFDIIESISGELFLIECNPRVSSGIHCLPQLDVAAAYGGMDQLQTPEQPAMLGYAMCLTRFFPAVCHRRISQWCQDYRQARDPIYAVDDIKIISFRFKMLAEVIGKMCKMRKGFQAISTADIEWSQ